MRFVVVLVVLIALFSMIASRRRTVSLNSNKVRALNSKRGLLCIAWKALRSTAQGLCVKAIGAATAAAISALKNNLCPKCKSLSGLCVKAVDAIAPYAGKGAAFCCGKLCDWVSSKCRRFR